MTGFALAARGNEVVVVHHLGADESALQVGVDPRRGSRRSVSAADGPGLDLVLADGEKGNQVEQSVGGTDESRPRRFGDSQGVEKVALVLRFKLRDFRLYLRGERNRVRSALLGRFSHLRRRRSTRGLLWHIDRDQHRLPGEEMKV